MLSKGALDLIVSNENVSEPEVKEVNVDGTDDAVVEQTDADIEKPGKVESADEEVSVESTTEIIPVSPVAETAIQTAMVSPADNPSATIPVEVVVESPTVPLDVQQVIDTDDTLALTEKRTSEITDCHERAQRLLDIQHSLENYSLLLKKSGLDGISQESAAFMSVGFEMITKELGIANSVSTESIKDINPRSSRIMIKVSKESISEIASKAKELFIKALEKLIELIKKGLSFFHNKITPTSDKIDELLARIRNIKGDAVETEFKVSSPDMLYADGVLRFGEADAQAGLVGLALFTTKAYPELVTKYFNGIAKMLKSSKNVEDLKSTVEYSIGVQAKPLKDLGANPTVKVLFPGNYRVDIKTNGLSYGMIKDEEAKAPDAEVELTVRPLVKIRDTLLKLKHALNSIQSGKEEQDKMIDALTDMKKAISAFDPGDDATANGILDMFKARVMEATPRTDEFISYLAKVIRAWVAVCEQELNHYK